MSKNRQSRHKKKSLLITAVCFLTLGFYFTTTNAYTLLKGYALYKWNESDTTEATAKLPEPKTKANSPDGLELYEERPETGDLMGELYIPKIEAHSQFITERTKMNSKRALVTMRGPSFPVKRIIPFYPVIEIQFSEI
jgi:sortase (surface protein transpeptidase)